MPRNGDGSSDNGPFEEGNITHGSGTDKPTKVGRLDKVADMPEHEAGGKLEGAAASGGGLHLKGGEQPATK
ncbi:hypothetical protein BT63DRAFT_428504 [Microthyrium microscopicum]|uniref:Uncharacterized protein n=1 Tax=Microthyrium microscopicum TaxID=703497 RepID=A0A6A6TZR3_9PEZI|nr:hypothetical protein BT63DRAFT_428504 [Microthyrium microscopicum]